MKPNQAAALAALLETRTTCRRCGTQTVPHPTGEAVCGPCWRHISRWPERVAEQAAAASREQARRCASERTEQ